MTSIRSSSRLLAGVLLGTGLFLATACGSISDQTLVTDSPLGAVYLQHLFDRGTTMRYGGPVKSFKANHPFELSPELAAKTLSGLRVGITTADEPANPLGIKPTPVFSAQEVAFLAPALSTALKHAQPDQRVKFRVGPLADTTDGTLYVNEDTLYVTLNHYHSPADTRDEQVGIYALSFSPVTAQRHVSGPQTWMEIEPNQPRVAVSIAALTGLPAPVLPVPASAPTSASMPANDTPSMKAVVEKQAQELEALKAELEALKKQIGGQTAPIKPSSPK
ncbi:MAG: hypothetical protein U0412_13335 [Nitrospira sp.]